MFRYWIPIAHGAFGPYDELLVVVAFLIFVAMLVAPPLLTWIKRRGNGGVLPQEDTPAAGTAAGEQAPNTDDHYRHD